MWSAFSAYLCLEPVLDPVSAVAYRLQTAQAQLHPHCLKLQTFVLHHGHQAAACVLMQPGVSCFCWHSFHSIETTMAWLSCIKSLWSVCSISLASCGLEAVLFAKHFSQSKKTAAEKAPVTGFQEQLFVSSPESNPLHCARFSCCILPLPSVIAACRIARWKPVPVVFCWGWLPLLAVF